MDYGVCDDYKQILEQYTYLHDPVAKYVIVLHKITKKHNSSWRWHKNGPYIGTQNHRCEYIGDEPEVEQVYSFQIFSHCGLDKIKDRKCINICYKILIN